MPDFMRIGGVTGWLRASAIAGAAGIPMSTHLYPEVAAHVMRVSETAHLLGLQDLGDPLGQKALGNCDGVLPNSHPPRGCLALYWGEVGGHPAQLLAPRA